MVSAPSRSDVKYSVLPSGVSQGSRSSPPVFRSSRGWVSENGPSTDCRQVTYRSADGPGPPSPVGPASPGRGPASAGNCSGDDEKNIVSPSSERNPSTVLRPASSEI